VIDPETKRYVDMLMMDHIIKISAIITSISETLRQKGVIDNDDFSRMLERSQVIISTVKTPESFNQLINDLDEIQKKIIDEAKNRKDWTDLK
jgi:hypothetical protein